MLPQIACLTVFVSHIIVAAPFDRPITVHRWDEISVETNKLAGDELARLARDGARNARLDAAAFRDAGLDDPLYYYSCDSTLVSFDEDPASDIVPYMTRRNVIYPVTSGARTIGIIRIKRLDSGQSQGFFGPADPTLLDMRKNILQETSILPDQRLSLLSTGLAGDFYIVEDGTKIDSMFPANSKTLAILGLPDEQLAAAPRLRPVDVYPQMKRVIAAAKRNATGKGFDRELKKELKEE
ncbi:MAG TPA: hypothetical protein VF247_11615 [Candidatus Krumholzibacteria bacterium]